VGVTALAGTRRIPLIAAAVAVLTLVGVMLAASSARATELVYWDNYKAEPATIGTAQTDGSGGTSVNLTGVEIRQPEGMAYDPVTNRLYLANEGPIGSGGQIAFVNLDGSGGGVFTAPGAPIKQPEGIAIDPATRTMYWANAKSGETSIAWAKLDGSAGGVLNTTGAKVGSPYRLALDPVGGRVYWGDFEASPGTLQYAQTDGSGGGEIPLATPLGNLYGMAVDPGNGRLYWLNSESTVKSLFFTGLSGGAVGSIPLGAADNDGYGVAIDPALGKAYWGNYGNAELATNAIGFTTFSGSTGGITPVGAPVNGPQDPVIIKSPSGSGAPQLTQSKAQLSCSQGSWAGDNPGGSVFQSPRSYEYKWSFNGATINGATGSSLGATSPGTYGCTVTATNQAGSASQSSSSSVAVTAASLKLSAAKKKAKAKPGKVVTFNVQVANGGDLASSAGQACVKLPKGKKARKALKPQKCKTLGALGSGGSATAKVGLKIKPKALPGLYKVTITVPGTAGVKVAVKVLPQSRG